MSTAVRKPPVGDRRRSHDSSFRTWPEGVYRLNRAAPIVTGEFAQAAVHHPILFDAADSSCGALVLLARTESHNPYVTGNGEWSPRTYIPERFRCYPLVPPESGEDTIGTDEVAMVPDPDDEGVPLFDRAGRPSTATRALFAVLRRHLRDRTATRRLQAWLEELDLLVAQDLQIALPNGRDYTLRSFWFIDPARLNRLENEQIVQLQRDGHLAWIHAHRVSLANLAHLEAVDGASAPEPEAAGEEVDQPEEVASTEVT